MSFVVIENESSFSEETVSVFFKKVVSFSNEWMYNVFSFLGWYGVPVFIFLTGFGLVRKYEEIETTPMDKSKFIFNNWFKLTALLLPAILLYIGVFLSSFIFSGEIEYIYNIYDRLFLLTFLNDILFPWVGCNPEVYWYFGLTLEFYFLYAFAIYKRPAKLLIILTIASIALQIATYYSLLGNPFEMLQWVRKNITGWMLPFAFGVLYARHNKKISKIWIYVIVIVSALLFIPVMGDPVLWQVSLICAIVLTIAAARISMKIPYWRDFWIFTGRISPFIFVAHPMVRRIFFNTLSAGEEPNLLLLITYFISVMICAILYKYVWQYTTPALKYGIDKTVSFVKKVVKSHDDNDRK